MSVLQLTGKNNIGTFPQKDDERGKKHISALFINLRKKCYQGQRGPVKETLYICYISVCVHMCAHVCVYMERERQNQFFTTL